MATRFSPGFVHHTLAGALLLTYKGEDHANNVAQSAWSFANKAIGTADADRWVVVLFVAHDASARTLNSVTIGGVTATVETQSGVITQTAGICGIAFANVPSGTTATITFNYSGNFTASTANGVGIDYYTVVGKFNSTATDTLNDNSTTSPLTKNFTVPAGGVAFVVGNPTNAGKSVSGDFTTDDNFVQAWAGGVRWAASVANSNNFASATKTATMTSWSSAGALIPRMGRAYGHT